MADTGHGATLALATTGSIGALRSITLPEETIEDIKDSDLSTNNYETYVAGDLAEPGEISADILFDPTSNTVPAKGVSETVTVTWPIHTSGNTTNATYAGTGYVKAFKLPDMQTNELQLATITIKLDGKTEPAFTQEAA